MGVVDLRILHQENLLKKSSQNTTKVLSMMRGYKDEPELVEDMMPWSDLMQQSCGVNKACEDS